MDDIPFCGTRVPGKPNPPHLGGLLDFGLLVNPATLGGIVVIGRQGPVGF